MKDNNEQSIKQFSFDYDPENDNLFLYNPKSKSKASIELDNIIIDFNSKKQLSAIEITNATKILASLIKEKTALDKNMLQEIKDCKIEIIKQNNHLIIRLFIVLKSKKIFTPIVIPTINEPSPSIAG
jgi:uncharacterized protein YuzE